MKAGRVKVRVGWCIIFQGCLPMFNEQITSQWKLIAFSDMNDASILAIAINLVI